MTPRLRDVVVEQRNLVLRLVDRAEAAPTLSAVGRLRKIVLAQIAAEELVLLPLMEGTSLGASYGGEHHALLRFVLERVCAPDASRGDRAARLRVLRDLLVHQLERDEHVMLERLSAEVGERAASTAARRLVKALEGADDPPASQIVGIRMDEARRTGR